MRYICYGFTICFLILIIGFILFVGYIDHIKIPKNPTVNAIIVLTGEPNRIEKAFELFENKIGTRLFISGVHRSVDKNILCQKIPIKPDLATCCIDIGYEALDTAGNAKETSEWIKKHGYTDILVVTSNYHMPRILFELQKIDTVTKFIPYPVMNSHQQNNFLFLDMKMLKKIFIEYLKILLLVLNFLIT